MMKVNEADNQQMQKKTFYKGCVEEAIAVEFQKVWDTYLLVNVEEKNGNEVISENLLECLSNNSQYHGLQCFFEKNLDTEVWITDDMISLKNEADVDSFFMIAIGIKSPVHLRVAKERVNEVENQLYEAAKLMAEDAICIAQWRRFDKTYLFELKKRFHNSVAECFIRFYEDGNGVIIYVGKVNYQITYFTVQSPALEGIVTMALNEMEEIIAKPVYMGEDDRDWNFSVCLTYNLELKYPKAEKMLERHQTFETKMYCDHEREIKIIRKLLNAVPEIETVWAVV